MQYIAEAREILKGNTASLQAQMMEQMQQLASEMRFEEAESIKRKYLLLDNYRAHSEVVSSMLHNIDVFNIEDSPQVAYVNYLHVVKGCICQAFTFEFPKKLDETPQEILVLAIGEIRSRYSSESKEIITPFPVELSLQDILITVPQRGDKKKLLELSKLNVLQYKKDKQAQSDKLNPEQKATRLGGEEVQTGTRLKENNIM